MRVIDTMSTVSKCAPPALTFGLGMSGKVGVLTFRMHKHDSNVTHIDGYKCTLRCTQWRNGFHDVVVEREYLITENNSLGSRSEITRRDERKEDF